MKRLILAVVSVGVIGIAALLIWWSIYFWHHTPARQLLERGEGAPAAHQRRAVSASDQAAGEFGRRARNAVSALALAAADVAAGLVVISLFAVGTGIYVRRFEVWLQARRSGEAMTFAGTGLDDKALAANNAREQRP